MSIFKACDVRGTFGIELTPQVARRLGLAVGTILAGRKVIVGGDLRPSTAMLKEEVIAGLLATGCHVLDVGILPTPAFYFAKDLLAADGGVMVTGSHNPPADNGFKLSLGPLPITEEELAEVERLMASMPYDERHSVDSVPYYERRHSVDSVPHYERAEVVERYIDAIRSRFITNRHCEKRSKVVIDAGNGCYSRIAPALLRELGYDVVELFCEPDGRFPGRHPNPAIAANLSALCETVVAHHADLGAAYDGDGDRVVFVDERGRVVESDRAIVLFARYLLHHPGVIIGSFHSRLRATRSRCNRCEVALRRLNLACAGRLCNGCRGFEPPGIENKMTLGVITGSIDGQKEVVYDLKCSSIVPEEVRRAGGVPIMERSGHAFIKTTLLRRKAILGGEISGHFFFGELGGDDGLYATLLMLQIVAEAGRGLAAMVDDVPRYPITPDIRLPCPAAEAQAIVEELAQAFAVKPDCQVNRLDGVRIAWPDGWALIRPSVTEPLLTLRFEAHTEPRLAEIQTLVVSRSPGLTRIWPGNK